MIKNSDIKNNNAYKSKEVKLNFLLKLTCMKYKKLKYTRVQRKRNFFSNSLTIYLLKKYLIWIVSFAIFIMFANFMLLGIHTSSNNISEENLLSEISPETDNNFEENLNNIPTVTSDANSIANSSGIFYDYLMEDDSLDSDGIIGMKYDEYTIENGDNLTVISKKIGVNLDTLVSVNRISNANKLRPGQKIKIPNRNGLLYAVQKGESLEEITEKYEIDLNKVLSFNKIYDKDNINAGDEIFLPGAKYTLEERIDKFGQMFSLPTKVTRISSVFGYRVHPITKVRTKHMGVDIQGSLNTPIYAARKGKVIFAGYSGGYGNLVIVRHDKGYTTYYGHLNKITTRVGANVGQGTMIGRMGSTGNSTGSHLHFEVRRNGVALNPVDFISISKFIRKR